QITHLFSSGSTTTGFQTAAPPSVALLSFVGRSIGPVGVPVPPRRSDLLLLFTVRQHHPDLFRARAVGFKNEVAAVRRPRRMLVAARVVGQLYGASGSDFDHVYVVGSGVREAPVEGHERPVWRPGRRAGVAPSRHQPPHVG